MLHAYRLEQGRWAQDADLVERRVARGEDRMPVLEFLWRVACER